MFRRENFWIFHHRFFLHMESLNDDSNWNPNFVKKLIEILLYSIIALTDPLSLNIWVICLVSTPEIPNNLFFFSQFCKLSVALKFDCIEISSLITNPFAAGFLDSTSCWFTPTLPICGNVKVIIWFEYEGSVNISWYPKIDVLKHNSPIIWPW